VGIFVTLALKEKVSLKLWSKSAYHIRETESMVDIDSSCAKNVKMKLQETKLTNSMCCEFCWLG
jgi:hypothetical protein